MDIEDRTRPAQNQVSAFTHCISDDPAVDALQLTSREREVAVAVCRGLANKQIGHELDITLSTVNNHVAAILHKLGCRNRVDVVIRLGHLHTK